MILTPVTTELLSGNMVASQFFLPHIFLLLTTVVYGFPVLMLREIAVRRRLGIAGILLLGLAYGIFNEGIISKTYYGATNVPDANYNSYGFTCGVAFPWVISITLWHAFHSMLYPVMAIYYFFPEHRHSPWLNKRAIICMIVPTIAIGLLFYFGHDQNRPAGDLQHFVAAAILAAVLILTAANLPGLAKVGEPGPFKKSSIGLGVLNTILAIAIPARIVALKLSPAVFYIYDALYMTIVILFLSKRAKVAVTSVLLFGIGDDLLMSLLVLAAAISQRNLQKAAASAIFLLVFVWLCARIRRQSTNSPSAPDVTAQLS